ncbi:hypothetical protein F511_26132 [Dorcoceras hygrometricum]|uniref:CCHC-type domain-containing protein n=1 Tax=Dorcoceras hygrometricum TaxID=472368 RepID=A0A2Z7CVH2_9LAMI|nr:hypothetical protein F511_26132 [Dorcoceras hygrometricum]
MNVEELIVRLRIEEDNRNSERSFFTPNVDKANVVEHGDKYNAKRKPRPSGKDSKLGARKDTFKKKFVEKCYNCDGMGHKASDCKKPKRAREANTVDDISHDVSNINLCAVVSEVYLIGSNPREWWIDTGATRQVCSDKEMFATLHEFENGEKLYMRNSATSEIKGQGKVVLKMTSRKELTLNNVLYVQDIRKNLISGSLLNKHDFRIVFESDKVVVSKNGMYVGRGYVSDGLFKLNVMAIKPKVNKVNPSAYLLESPYLWHGRLGHVNYDTIHRLINLKNIPTFQIYKSHKCEICVEAKQTRSSFKTIERNTEPLDLIHTDVCDLKGVQTRGGNKYLLLSLRITPDIVASIFLKAKMKL